MRRIARRDDTLLNNLTPTHSATALTTQSLNAPIYSLFMQIEWGFGGTLSTENYFTRPMNSSWVIAKRAVV